jgi:mannose-6-phosphate isomerase-like protein (cupin superfamily)
LRFPANEEVTLQRGLFQSLKKSLVGLPARLLLLAEEADVTHSTGFFGMGEGRTYQIGHVTLAFKPVLARGDYSVWESTSPAGSGASLHRHTYDEWHVIIEGRYECQVDNEVRTLGPGEMMFAPGGTPHRLKNLGPGIGRQLGIGSPAGVFEAFIAEVVNSQVDSGNPSRQGAPAFRDIAAKYGIEFIEPEAP